MVDHSLAITSLRILAIDRKKVLASGSMAAAMSIASSAIMSMKSAPNTVRALGVVVMMKTVLVGTITTTTTIMNGLVQILRIRGYDIATLV
jgi:hypothetical protein